MESTGYAEALSAAIKPLERRDVTALVIDRLKTLMEKGLLNVGSKLPPESEMTRLLGVSRPSLRQAYKALNILGIIRAVPGDGTYINENISNTLSTPLSFLVALRKIDFDEVFEFRILVEGELASRAAARASEEEIRSMNSQLAKMAAALGEKNLEDYRSAEYEFHMLIARAAHNGLLLEIILIVSDLLRDVRRKLANLVPASGDDFQQHRDVFLAIQSRSPANAGEAMRRHVRIAMDLAKEHNYTDRT
jgi:GntR family transcriptional regulator, transcriptional repressor for pyruvate dehydrogenase complex